MTLANANAYRYNITVADFDAAISLKSIAIEVWRFDNMKNFLFGLLTAVMMFGFGNFAQASDFDTQNMCCRGNYYCASDNGSDYCYNSDGEYCGRYGCGGNYRR